MPPNPVTTGDGVAAIGLVPQLGAGVYVVAEVYGAAPKLLGAVAPKPAGAVGCCTAPGGVYVVPTLPGKLIPPLLAPLSFS